MSQKALVLGAFFWILNVIPENWDLGIESRLKLGFWNSQKPLQGIFSCQSYFKAIGKNPLNVYNVLYMSQVKLHHWDFGIESSLKLGFWNSQKPLQGISSCQSYIEACEDIWEEPIKCL